MGIGICTVLEKLHVQPHWGKRACQGLRKIPYGDTILAKHDMLQSNGKEDSKQQVRRFFQVPKVQAFQQDKQYLHSRRRTCQRNQRQVQKYQRLHCHDDDGN